MKSEKLVAQELETNEFVISSLNSLLVKSIPTIIKGHEGTPFFWVSQHYFRDFLSTKDFELLKKCNQLSYLYGQKETLKYILEKGPYKKRKTVEEIKDSLLEDDGDNPIPYHIRLALGQYHGMNSHKVTQMSLMLYYYYKNGELEKANSLIEELKKYVKI